jgi:hypothetical protein
MKLLNYYGNKSLFVNHDGKIIEVKIEKVVYRQAGSQIVLDYHVTHNGKKLVIPSKYGEYLFYRSSVGLVNNDPDERVKISDVCRWFNGLKYNVSDNEDGNTLILQAYRMVDSTPKYGTTMVSSITFDEKERISEVTLLGEDSVDNYFDTKEECLAYTKVIAEDYDGVESNVMGSGYMKDFTTYSDEQMKAIKNLRKAVEQLDKVGLKWYIGHNDMGIINAPKDTKITDIEWYEYNECDTLEIFDKNVETIPLYQNVGERAAIVKK